MNLNRLRIVAVAVVAGAVTATNLMAVSWSITNPAANSSRPKTSAVAGVGSGEVGHAAVFQFGRLANDVFSLENETVITAVEVVEDSDVGVWTKDLSPPANNWTESPFNMQTYTYDPSHQARVIRGATTQDTTDGHKVTPN